MSSYLWGKEMGLDYAEFYLRHVHPTQNEAEKDLLRAAADAIRERKMVAQAERKAMLEKSEQQVEKDKQDFNALLNRAGAMGLIKSQAGKDEAT